jgi:L-iditol 2-dehydrogenase
VKALVLEDRRSIAIREVADPECGPGEAVLRVEATAICGSDIHRYLRGHREYPIVLGHEAAGSIVAVGVDVDVSLVGARAAVIPLVPCFTCARCAIGLFSLCTSYSFIGSRRPGALAEAVAVPRTNLCILPADMPAETGALIEPATVARHMLAAGEPAPGGSAVVFGAGSIGLMTVQWLRLRGVTSIVSVDPIEANRRAALELGASAALDPEKDFEAGIRRHLGDGADVIYEASGSPAALSQTIDAAKPRATVVLGGNQPQDASIPMTFVERLMRKELRVIGSFMSYSAPWPGLEWSETVDIAQRELLDARAMISHLLPLSKAPEVFEAIATHSLPHRKVVFVPGE